MRFNPVFDQARVDAEFLAHIANDFVNSDDKTVIRFIGLYLPNLRDAVEFFAFFRGFSSDSTRRVHPVQRFI